MQRPSPTAAILVVALALVACNATPPATRLQSEPSASPAFAWPQGLDMVTGNRSGSESAFDNLFTFNRDLIAQMAAHTSPEMTADLEKRFAAESEFPMKLLYAQQAAIRGSIPCKKFILESLKKNDYDTLHSTLDALAFCGDEDWILDAAIAALNDQRKIKNGWTSDDFFTVSYLAESKYTLTLSLGDAKCKRAVPTLINLVQHAKYPDNAIRALGEIGDTRAIPVLVEFIDRVEKTGKVDPHGFDDHASALKALDQLKMPNLLEFLVAHEHTRTTIELLEKLGDPRAIPTLQAAQTRPDLEDAAKIALATLEPGDPFPRYAALIQDHSLSQYTRVDAVDRLATHVDPRAIPVLHKTAREDPSGAVVDHAIIALSEYKHKAAVTALIDLFAANFEGKHDWKWPYTPAQFHERIATSLQQITGQSFGLNAEAWQKWWQTEFPKSDLPN